jgi:hypothetical protein
VKHTIVLLVLLITPCFPEVTGKTACNAHNRGRFWPEQANTDSAFASKAARCGELEICSRGNWKYGWQLLTVHVDKLGKSPKASLPGCDLSARDAAGQSGPASERESALK